MNNILSYIILLPLLGIIIAAIYLIGSMIWFVLGVAAFILWICLASRDSDIEFGSGDFRK